MNSMALTKNVPGNIGDVCSRLIEAIKPAGFGILTRIDFDKKIKEKIGESINPCIILGACNPRLAYEAYKQSSDVALLVPCNIVLTEIENGSVRIEVMRPTQMLKMLPLSQSSESVIKAEQDLEAALKNI